MQTPGTWHWRAESTVLAGWSLAETGSELGSGACLRAARPPAEEGSELRPRLGWGGGSDRVASSPLLPPAVRPEGKNSRLFVFSISMASVAHWSLDVAADSQEELQDWVKKIREVAQTADARVSLRWPSGRGQPRHLAGAREMCALRRGMVWVC